MADTREHHFIRSIKHPAENVFQALITPSHIRNWWSCSQVVVIPEPGGIWCATWGSDEDNPEFIVFSEIKAYEPPHRLVLHKYRYVSQDGGFPFQADFETTFEIHPGEDGIDLTVDQVGFPNDPAADEYYEDSERGWNDSLDALVRFLNLNA